MDRRSIFSKTARGLQEASGKTSILPRDLRNLLKKIDGKATVEQLSEKTGTPEQELTAALSKLATEGFARELVVGVQFGATASQSPAAASENDLDFTAITHKKPTGRADDAAKQKAKADEIARAAAATRARDEMTALKKVIGDAAAATARAHGEVDAKAKADAAARMQAEIAAKAKLEAEARAKAEARARDEADVRAKAEAEARAKAEAEARARAEAEARAKAEAEARAKAEAEARARAEAEARAKAEAEARARADAEARAKKEAEELRGRLEAERRAREETERVAKLEAEQLAREAEERVRRQAEEHARKEAEERARIEASLRAQLEAERRAREDAEARAEAEAEAREQQEAAEQARRQAEEGARLRAEQLARRQEEERARYEAELARKQAEALRLNLEAERKAREDAEVRARAEAEARSQREAEERERRQAEENARLEAEERTRREAEERARIEAERARQEAEELRMRLEAERRAREEAEERARAEAEARSQLEAEERERREAEESARREKEEQERREAENRERREKKEQERRSREEQARAAKEAKEAKKKAAREERERAKAEAEAAEEARKEARARERAKEDEEKQIVPAAANPPQGTYVPAHVIHAQRQRRLGRPIALGLFLLLLAALIAIHFVGLDPVPFEKAAEDRFGQPVNIRSINISLLPLPQIRMEEVTIGKAPQVRIATIKVVPEFDSLFDQRKVFKSVELDGAVLPQEFVGAALWGRGQGGLLRIDRVVARGTKLEFAGFALPPLDVDAVFGPERLKTITFANSDKKLAGTLQFDGDKAQIEFSANPLSLPFAPHIELHDFSGKGAITEDEFVLNEFDAKAFDGSLRGSARLRWGEGWSLDGQLVAQQMDAAKAAAPLLSAGRLEGKGSYAMKAAAADKLLASARVEGSIAVQRGAVAKVDLTRVLQGAATTGGTTLFSELGASLIAEGGRLQVRQLRIAAGLLSGSGALDIDAQKNLAGRLQLELRAQATQARATLAISGSLKDPRLRRSN